MGGCFAESCASEGTQRGEEDDWLSGAKHSRARRPLRDRPPPGTIPLSFPLKVCDSAQDAEPEISAAAVCKGVTVDLERVCGEICGSEVELTACFLRFVRSCTGELFEAEGKGDGEPRVFTSKTTISVAVLGLGCFGADRDSLYQFAFITNFLRRLHTLLELSEWKNVELRRALICEPVATSLEEAVASIVFAKPNAPNAPNAPIATGGPTGGEPSSAPTEHSSRPLYEETIFRPPFVCDAFSQKSQTSGTEDAGSSTKTEATFDRDDRPFDPIREALRGSPMGGATLETSGGPKDSRELAEAEGSEDPKESGWRENEICFIFGPHIPRLLALDVGREIAHSAEKAGDRKRDEGENGRESAQVLRRFTCGYLNKLDEYEGAKTLVGSLTEDDIKIAISDSESSGMSRPYNQRVLDNALHNLVFYSPKYSGKPLLEVTDEGSK